MTDTSRGTSNLLKEVSLNLNEVESTIDKKNQELVAQRYDLMKVINSMITRIRALKRFVRDIKKTPGIYEKTDSTEHAESLDIRLNQINDRLKILIRSFIFRVMTKIYNHLLIVQRFLVF